MARPIGGVVIGHYGDKLGRKSMLVLTLVMMGAATFCIGLLPTYETIGPWAAVLLVLVLWWRIRRRSEETLAIALAELPASATPCRLAVIAMGKCGGRELNYVSDVDVIVVDKVNPTPTDN